MPEPLINATIDLHAERIDRRTWINPTPAPQDSEDRPRP
jgi:hypothetical protein